MWGASRLEARTQSNGSVHLACTVHIDPVPRPGHALCMTSESTSALAHIARFADMCRSDRRINAAFWHFWERTKLTEQNIALARMHD